MLPSPDEKAAKPVAKKSDAPTKSATSAKPKVVASASHKAAATSPQTLLADIASEPLRWQWQRAGGEPQAMTDAVQRWLAQLAAATNGRWRAGLPVSVAADATELRLLRDGALQARVRLGTEAVSVEPVGASASPAQAPLPGTAVEALKQALADAVR